MVISPPPPPPPPPYLRNDSRREWLGGGGGGGTNLEGVLSDGQLDCPAGSIYRPSSLIHDERSGLGTLLREGGRRLCHFMLQERQSNVNLRLHNHTTHANMYKLPQYSLVSGFCKT